MNRKEYLKNYNDKNRSRLNVSKNTYAKNNPEQRRETTAAYRKKIKTDKVHVIKQILRTAKMNASKKGLCFEIDFDFVSQLIEKQSNLCALTGVKFSYGEISGVRSRPNAPSIDRMNNTEGYHRENVQIVSVMVNKSKNEFPQELFDAMCLARAERLQNGS